MRKMLSLGLSLAVLVVLGAAMHRLEVRRIPDWRIELEEYIAGRWPAETGVRVRSVAAAREPWNMTRDMAHPVTRGGTWQSVRLPFPPARVVCVLLDRDESLPARETVYQVVFVCHHSDGLWKHGWVVHEGVGDPFSEGFQRGLSALGCDLRLGELHPPSREGQFAVQEVPSAI